MHLSSIFNEYGIDIKQTRIVRHPLNNEEIKTVYERRMIKDYQSTQSKRCFDNCKYVATFMGTNKTEALFVGLYEIEDIITGSEVQNQMPKDYPYPEHFDETHIYYIMKEMDAMSELLDKLVIEWGKSTLSWNQWATTDKEVLAIANRDEIPFPGYEELIVTYSVLGELVEGKNKYRKWIDALSVVNGVYLICDVKRNKQYVGSTYNTNGILGRWTEYYKTHHGSDEGLKLHLKKHPDAYYDFQFTILRILPKNISDKEASGVENLFKDKLCTRNEQYGLNKN